MTPHAEWRLRLARQIAPVFADYPPIRAAIVGGSVARGVADAYSDLEIGLFWEGPPDEQMRRELVGRLGVLDDFRAYALDPDRLGSEEAHDDFFVGGDRDSGFNVEFKHKTVAAVDGYLDRALSQYEPDDQRLLVVLDHAVPLCGGALVEGWQGRLRPFPDELARREIERHLPSGPRAEWTALAEQGAAVQLTRELAHVGWGLVVALAALNGVYAANAKWVSGYLDEMTELPDDCFARLEGLFRLDPAGQVESFAGLIEEVRALVAERWPDVGAGVASKPPDFNAVDSLRQALERCAWSWSNRAEFYAERGDLFFFYGCLCHRMYCMARIVLALNGIFSAPGVPLLPQIDGLAVAPADFAARVRALVRADLRTGYLEGEALIGETLDLVAVHAPQEAAALAESRAAWQDHRRRKWDAPPPGLLAEEQP